MSLEQNVIINCNGFNFGKSQFNFLKSKVNIFDVNSGYSLDKSDSCLTADYDQQYAPAISARDNEVSLNITNTLSGIDNPRSFINEGSVFELGNFRSFSGFTFSLLFSVGFNPSSVYALDVTINAVFLCS